jgi:hypothetical protein
MTAVLGLAGMLSDKQVDIGTSIYRSGPEPLAAQPKAKRFTGRIVVLVDDITVSASEMLSSTLQEAGRALVVGEKTAGEALPAVTVDLPTGARLLYPVANYKSAKGKLLEGTGVAPDVVVPLDRRSLLEGRDPQLDAALRLLKDDAAFSRLAKPDIAQPIDSATPATVRIVESISSGDAVPPPPPPPVKKAPLKVLGEVTVKAPPSVSPPPVKPRAADPRVTKIIDAFAAAAGSPESFAAVKKYTMLGELDIDMKGVQQTFDYKIYRELPDKYAEISASAWSGEIRNIHDGKTMHVKTDFGIDQKMPAPPSSVDLEYLAPVANVRKIAGLAELQYLGIFERDGSRVHTIEAKADTGMPIALTFDVKTGMLASLVVGPVAISYSDFRKVGNLMLAFRVDTGKQMAVRFSEVRLNSDIDPAVFKHKEYCFDKPN